MKTRILLLFISLVLFQCLGVCQSQSNDCTEKESSPQKLFVFIGELLEAKKISARAYTNDAKFSATYRIIDRICGDYSGDDTITFDVIQVFYDSSFKKNKYQLLMLTKDTGQNEDYVLWADLYFDVFKTVNNQWAGSYMSKNYFEYEGRKVLKPKKTRFSKDAFYDTRSMTREEIDITYPEPFYKIKKGKAIPLLGYSITEIFQHQKEGTLADADIYDHTELPEDTTGGRIVVQDVQLEDIKEKCSDSVEQAIENAYLTIKDSLLRDPFNEANINLLLENCRSREDYGVCSQFFESLSKIYRYPKLWNRKFV